MLTWGAPVAWLLVCYGVTLVLTGSKITAPLRSYLSERFPFWGAFAVCPMCVGWWVGLGVSLALPDYCPIAWAAAHPLITHLANAFASSAACWKVHVILAKLGAESL